MCLILDSHKQSELKQKLPKEGIYYKAVIKIKEGKWRSPLYPIDWKIGPFEVFEKFQAADRIEDNGMLVPWNICGGAHFYTKLEDAVDLCRRWDKANPEDDNTFYSIIKCRIKRSHITHIGKSSTQDKGFTILASKGRVLGKVSESRIESIWKKLK